MLYQSTALHFFFHYFNSISPTFLYQLSHLFALKSTKVNSFHSYPSRKYVSNLWTLSYFHLPSVRLYQYYETCLIFFSLLSVCLYKIFEICLHFLSFLTAVSNLLTLSYSPFPPVLCIQSLAFALFFHTSFPLYQDCETGLAPHSWTPYIVYSRCCFLAFPFPALWTIGCGSEFWMANGLVVIFHHFMIFVSSICWLRIPLSSSIV